MTEFDPGAVRTQFGLAVLLRQRPARQPWLTDIWEVHGAVVETEPTPRTPTPIHSGADGVTLHRCGGLVLKLHVDEAESYYFNLLSERPALYVITRKDDCQRPLPFKVSASFDEANAYAEAEEEAFPVPLPVEIIPAVERFVLTHYVPEKRTKRRRQNWKGQGPRS
ncbi:MAG: DUF3305 domain-containing protein [Candidatus Competibacterales bacterium]